MRLIILLAGLYCLQQTQFSSDNWWASRAFPVLDFFFLCYLMIDLMLFAFLQQQGESLRARRHAQDDLWHWVYAQASRYVDADRRFAWVWEGLGRVLEIGLMLLLFVQAGGLLFDALLNTGV